MKNTLYSSNFIAIILILIYCRIWHRIHSGKPKLQEQVLSRMEKSKQKINIEYAKANLKDTRTTEYRVKRTKSTYTLYEDENPKEEGYKVTDSNG